MLRKRIKLTNLESLRYFKYLLFQVQKGLASMIYYAYFSRRFIYQQNKCVCDRFVFVRVLYHESIEK